MDEEETITENSEEDTNEDSTDGVQQKAISELDRADQIAERQKRENDRREELLTREEALAARKAVGGDIDAGQSKEKPKPLTDKEYAEALERGEVNPLKEDGFV